MKNIKLNKRLVLLITGTILSVLTIVIVSLAWYVDVSSTPSFSFKSANVASETILYKGYDFDYDGYLDVEADADGTLTEKFEALTKITQENEGKTESFYAMEFANVMPSYNYTWKVKITNNGDVDAYVSMLINKASLSNLYVKVFSVTVSRSNFTGYGAKVYLGNLDTTSEDDYLQVYCDTSNAIKCPPSELNNHEYLIKFEMETFDVLVDEGILTNDDYALYQALQGTNVSYFDFLEIMLSSNLD